MVITLLILLISFGIMDYWAAVHFARQNLKDNITNTLNFSRKI